VAKVVKADFLPPQSQASQLQHWPRIGASKSMLQNGYVTRSDQGSGVYNVAPLGNDPASRPYHPERPVRFRGFYLLHSKAW
jgi:hypothetical protein